MDLSNLSVAELRALHAQVAKRLKAAAQQDIAKARDEIYTIAQRAGISLHELVKVFRVTSGRVTFQYRNSANADQQWTGRGRQPKWVKEWLNACKTLDALCV